ncbi:MAG TPA: CBS domain-containing protein [Mycobacteriales bacterium]|jgi:CBS domain-containing protein|nr:CBS domain-containing protein [Mycobacteriales bacterium]
MTTTVRRPARHLGLEEMRVRDVMTRDFIRLGTEVSLLEAFGAMVRSGVHHMPVVRANGRCLALLDMTTVVRRLPEDLVAQGAAPLVVPGSIGPLSVLVDEPLTSAAAAMHDVGSDACCAVDAHGRMVGLLTARDIVAAVGRAAPH